MMKNTENFDTCRCRNAPPEGNFIRNNYYKYTYVIDAIDVYDEDNNEYSYDDYTFLWYFEK